MYFEVLGSNPEKIHDFYSELFHWKIDANNEHKFGYVNTGSDQGIQVGIGHARFSGQRKILIYVSVPDLDEVLDQAVALGGQALIQPTVIGGHHFATFEDPDGNPVGLIQHVL